MTPEILTILGVGVALAAVLVASAQRTDKRFEQLEGRLNTRFQQIETRLDRLDDRVERLENRMSALEQSQARLEGLLDGLREALFERAARA